MGHFSRDDTQEGDRKITDLMRCANPMIFENQDNQFSYSISDFLIWAENDLALFGVSGQFVNQPRMGFRVVESELF
jgi:hypothetical protein